ncbi:MAG: HAMP domain-containing protein, partial [Phycicoccus sp.]
MSLRLQGSARLRLTVVYSLVVFGLAALVAVVLFGALQGDPDVRPVTERVLAESGVEDGDRFVRIDPTTTTPEQLRAFEGAVKERLVDYLRPVVAVTVGALFIVSLAVGWVLAGRVLRPVRQITETARRIGAADLDERLRLVGPDDELRRLGDTFDAML